MKHIVFICLVCLVGLTSCKVVSSRLASSTSITINFPSNLQGASRYSLCLQRVNQSETDCSSGFLVENNVAEAGIDSKIKNNCPSGYKLKLWLWSEDSTRKNLFSIDRSSSNLKFEDGFILIPQSELNGNLKLKLHLNYINSSSNFNTSCQVDNLNSNSDNSTKEKNVPTGELIEQKTNPEITKGYPSMIIYSASWCGPCQTLKYQIKSSKKAMFKGKMHIYDIEDGASSPYGVSAYPTIDFYDKEGKHQGQITGGDWNQINSYFNRLTN